MAAAHQFFVVVFSRTTTSRIRPEAIMSALSQGHATWVASHFDQQQEGAIVLSRTESLLSGKGAKVMIQARFGGAVPPQSRIWAFLKRSLGTLALAHPLTKTKSVTNPARAKQLRIRHSIVRRRRPL
jgi:hypothetical protein